MRGTALAILIVLIGSGTMAHGKDRGSSQFNLSQKQIKELQEFRRQVATQQCPGPFPTPIAVTVQGGDHHTSGHPVLLTYLYVFTNEGGAWGNNSTFVAPCDGLYFFAIDFVKDPYYFSGTKDDVTIALHKNGQRIVEAWAGETDSRGRGTGVCNIILRLKSGDWIQTVLASEVELPRNIGSYRFTGYRIGD